MLRSQPDSWCRDGWEDSTTAREVRPIIIPELIELATPRLEGRGVHVVIDRGSSEVQANRAAKVLRESLLGSSKPA